MLSICSGLSTEQGPAITTTCSLPKATFPTRTTVGSGLKARLASL